MSHTRDANYVRNIGLSVGALLITKKNMKSNEPSDVMYLNSEEYSLKRS